MLDVGRGDAEEGMAHKSNPGKRFVSASWHSGEPVPYAQFKAVLKALPTSVYRSKGVLYCSDFPDERIALCRITASDIQQNLRRDTPLNCFKHRLIR